MKNILKKTAAILAVLLMLVQMIPVTAETYSSGIVVGGMQGYRELLEIVASKGTFVLVGQTLALDVNEGYDSVKWTSENTELATIDENGLLTALKAGKVKVLAEQDGQSASAVVTVIDPDPLMEEAQQGNPAGTGPESTEEPTGESDPEGQEPARKQYAIIVINGESSRHVYDGEEHTLDTFVATSNQDFFDASKVRVVGEIGVSATDCGTYELKLKETDFAYDDPNVVATFVVNNGWMKITRAKVTVTADSLEKMAGEDDPELTATVEGLYGEDTVAYEFDRFPGETPGEYVIDVVGAAKQGNYSVSFAAGVLTIKKALNEYPLYNIVKINGTYYRLTKTTILSDKDPEKDAACILNAEDFIAEDYDFANLEIEIGGKKYVYNCKENAEAIVMGANYYEISKAGVVSIVKGKIGAINKSTNQPNWLIPEEDRYMDKNETDSIHRDFEIRLCNGKTPAVEQTVYNMLSVDGNASYYKLRTSTIKAQPLDKLKNGKVNDGEYLLEPYDFTNVTVTIDGVEYKYNDGSLGEYDNYFTVEFYNVEKVDYFNRDNAWFTKMDTWLDGAYEEYGTLPNKTTAIHANYKATTHKAKERTRGVSISSDWPEGKIAYPGAIITLTATPFGFGENVRYQWQRSAGNDIWEDIPGETGVTYTFILDDSTAHYIWRVVADE